MSIFLSHHNQDFFKFKVKSLANTLLLFFAKNPLLVVCIKQWESKGFFLKKPVVVNKTVFFKCMQCGQPGIFNAFFREKIWHFSTMGQFSLLIKNSIKHEKRKNAPSSVKNCLKWFFYYIRTYQKKNLIHKNGTFFHPEGSETPRVHAGCS